jgi:transglutaminase-like putative cysteine protease
MNAATATAAPAAFAAPRPAAPPSAARARAAELGAFAALAVLIALAWSRLVTGTPVWRLAVVVGAATLAAAAVQFLARRPRRRWVRVLAVAIPVLSIAVGLVAIGVPARLLLPANWGELGSHFRTAISELGATQYPYTGSDDWARIAALAAIPLFTGVIAALAFWRGARGPRLRLVALGIGIVAFALPSIMNSAAATLLDGAALFCVVCAWVWLPRLAGSGGRRMASIVGTVAVLSIPVVAAVGSDSPIVDYTNWNPFQSIADVSESFAWDQTYGPLDWQRNNTVLLHVQSHGPHYWRTIVLDQFDGFRWASSLTNAAPGTELPSGVTKQNALESLNPQWISKLTFNVGELTSDTVIGAGTILSVKGLDHAEVDGTRVALPSDTPLRPGDTYSVKAYVPDPTPDELRTSPQRFPAALSPYRYLSLPVAGRAPLPKDTGRGAQLDRGRASQAAFTVHRVVVPPWSPRATPDPGVLAAIHASPYAGAYALARRLTAGAHTEYAAVQAIEQHLKQNYTYNEDPPQHRYPLRAFLFRDRIGYCQQFSGSMALMLRLLGIPSRVASGFAPGINDANGDYRITDIDAHAWDEVYFSGIGWVPFDPTPGVAPAARPPGALHALPAPTRVGPRELLGSQPAPNGAITGAAPRSDSSSGFPWALVVLAGLALAATGAFAVLILLRERRYRALPTATATALQLRELERALLMLRYRIAPGDTLLGIERRLATTSGPVAAGYAASIRRYRYAPNIPEGPTLGEREALRQELAANGGTFMRLRALLAIPPGAPSVPRQLRKREPGESDGANL